MIGRQTFERKHGTAERWHVCDCEECLAGLGVVTCPAPLQGHDVEVLSLGDRIREALNDGARGSARSLAFAARCVPGVLGAHAVPTGVGAVTVHVCITDIEGVDAVSQAVWEASPATVAVSLDFHRG